MRVPTIPTFNDTCEEISQIAQFAKEKMRVEEMNLLPYHRFGKDKYDNLNREYLMGELLPPDDEKMELLKKAAEGFGIKVKIGG